MSLVLVRMPTYRRPILLTRAIGCLQAQTHQDWICEVRDDCPDGSARHVVEEIGDHRIHYVQNRPQKFMVSNLDDCYLRENTFRAEYFFMLEDDNQIRPTFMKTGIEIIEQMGVSICQLNQVVEHNSGQEDSYIGETGIFDETFEQRVYTADEIRLAMFGAIGISNGAVFWSKNIRRELAIRVPTLPTLEEYLRAALLSEPVYICTEKLAIWAKNEQTTTRNLGTSSKRIRRELDLKCSMIALRKGVWRNTPMDLKESFLRGAVLKIPFGDRILALKKAGIPHNQKLTEFDLKASVRRLAIENLGRTHPSVEFCLRRDMQT